MPPNNKAIAIKLDYNNQDALPFDQPLYDRKPGNVEAKVNDGSHPQPGSSQSYDIGENGEARGVRITTRARYTYNLDRYKKNAMLIIDNKHFGEEIDYTAQILTDTFEKYRFEVEVINHQTRESIISACERFFERDFTEYGSVGIVVLAVIDGFGGGFMASNAAFKCNEILKHITTHLPPTLRDKPKIFITETNSYDRLEDCFPTHNDILTFHIPVSILSPASEPLQPSSLPMHTLCNYIIQLGAEEDLFTIMEKSITDIYNTSFFSNCPIYMASTLTKELRLMKSE